MSVPCNGTDTNYGQSVVHRTTGTLYFTANSTNPKSSSNVRYVSVASGRTTSTLTIASGARGSWGSVLPGQYFPRVNRTGSANCNGLWPGAGSYNLNYTMTFNG